MKKYLILSLAMVAGGSVFAEEVAPEAVVSDVVAAVEAKEPEIVALLKQKIAEATSDEERAHYEAQLQAYYIGVYNQVIQEFAAQHAPVE